MGGGKGEHWRGRGGGVKPDEDKLSKGAGGSFGRLTLRNPTACQESLDYNDSNAHNFKEERKKTTMQIGV